MNSSTAHEARYSGVLDAVVAILRREGFAAFFKVCARCIAGLAAQGAVGVCAWGNRGILPLKGNPAPDFLLLEAIC